MQKLPIRIQSGHGPDGFHLTFNDVASGLVIFKMRLTHEQMGKILAGYTSMEEFALDTLDPQAFLNVGRTAHSFHRSFQCQDLSLLTPFRTGHTPEVLDAWASDVTTRCWTANPSWYVSNTNRVNFRTRRYENNLTEDKIAEIQACLDEMDPPKGLI